MDIPDSSATAYSLFSDSYSSYAKSPQSGATPNGAFRDRLLAFIEGRRPAGSPRVNLSGLPKGGLRFDWIAALLSALFAGGLFLDGWAHNHGKVDESFFTPWHAILYSGFALYGIFLLGAWIRNYRAGYDLRHALPYGYGLSLIGAAIFAVGGVLDLIWHTLFGIEVDVEALLSPTHLLLATGLFLMITGPLRAIWQRHDARDLAWVTGGPALLVLTLLLAVLMFFTQFAHPFVSPWAANDPSLQGVRGDLYVMGSNGSGQTRLTTQQSDAGTPSWAPSGDLLAFAAGDRHDSSSIYLIRSDGSGLKRLTASNGNASQPAWAPDGRQIAFVSVVNGVGHIILMNADGSKPRQLTKGDDGQFGPVWSPDGKRIAFESNQSGDFNLYTISADGKGQPTRLTKTSGADDFQPAFSPDGKLIAFVSTRDGDAQIYLMQADGSGQRRITTPASFATTHVVNYSPTWSPNGKQIAFATTRDGNTEVYVMNADGSHAANLSHNTGMDDGVGLIAWSRTGGAIAYGSAGHPVVDGEMSTALGIAAILLQAALFMGILLLALRRWALPLGAATLLFTVSAILISFMHDQFRLILVALLAGIAADALIFLLRPSPDRIRPLRIVAFVIPVVFFLLYFVVLALSGGVAWVIHLWLGAPVMAGILGLFVSFLVVPPNLDGSPPAFKRERA